MKKFTLFVALFFAVATSAFAQKGLHAAFKIMPQSTWMFNSDDSDAGADFDYVKTWGFAMGPSLNYHFTDGVGAGFELIFSRQGQRFESFGIEGYKRLNYLKIPVLLFFNSDPEAVVFFQGEIGPSFGILTSAKLLDEDGDEVPFVDLEEAHKKMNLGIVFGFGVGFNVHENFKINLGLRFDAAPGNAEDSDVVGDDRAVTRNVNGGIQLGLVYVLPID